MKNIGVLGSGFITWGGGVDFLRLVLGAIFSEFPPENHRIYLLLPINDRSLFSSPPPSLLSWALEKTVGIQRPRPRAQPPHLALEFIKDSLHEFWDQITPVAIDNQSSSIEAAYKDLKLDVILPCFEPLNVSPGVKWVGYAYDLQHKYFPHFFGPDDLASREKHFPAMLNQAKSIVVNAEAVRNDIDKFIPDHPAKVFSLPFCASPNPKWFGISSDFREKYALKSRYFAICNQFWMHKDHATAFLAFSKIAKDFPDIDLVCTGHTTDYRNEEYFNALMKTVSDNGLVDRIRILGSVPKADQISILRNAIALIQPTLFEGGPGGGAVFDAVSLGIRSIVSDIPVNKELKEETVTFFTAGDSDSLARVMAAELNSPEPERPSDASLLEAGRHRKAVCGQTLRKAILAAGASLE